MVGLASISVPSIELLVGVYEWSLSMLTRKSAARRDVMGGLRSAYDVRPLH